MAYTLWDDRLIHYEYIQELLEGRRVLEIGSGNGAGAAFVSAFARRVIALDTSQDLIQRSKQRVSSSNIEWIVGEPDRLEAATGSVDVVLVPELERWVTRGALLPEISRVLAPDGVALLAVRSADRETGCSGMRYDDFEEYLTQSFPYVRMTGAIPFFGMTMADFKPDGELEPQLDCSLVQEDEQPASYAALCSKHELPTLGYAVLQVPRRAAGPLPADHKSDLAVVDRMLQRELDRVASLEGQLQQQRERAEQIHAQLAEMSRRHTEECSRAEIQRVRAEAAERALAEWRQVAEEHHKRVESADRRCDSLLSRIEQGAAELSQLHHRMAELQGLRQADQWQIDELTGKLRKLEQEAGRTAMRLGDGQELATARARIAELEQALRERGEPEQETAKAERMLELEQRAIAAEQQTIEAEQRAAKADKRASKTEQRVAELERQAEQQLQEKAELEKELMRSESRVAEHSRRATNAESKCVQQEVRLKRAEAEAATLSKWAEELREELKVAQGKSTIRPATPEPEVAALRNELSAARQRNTDLEQRCDHLMAEAQRAKAALAEKEDALEEALQAVDRNLLQEVFALRRQNCELGFLREQLRTREQELGRVEDQLRDAEQAETELKRTRQELVELRERVRDIDGAGDELERLRLEARGAEDMRRKVEQLQEELEATRIELTRYQEELRGAPGLPEEAGWQAWGEEGEEEQEYDQYVGPEITAEPSAEEEEGWDVAERLRVQDRQIEALLEGATLHRAEMERYQAQLAEMDALVQELQGEERGLEQQLSECQRERRDGRQLVQQLRDESLQQGRELARLQGELRRCREEAAQASSRGDGAAAGSAPGLRDEIEREVRLRQKLEHDLQGRLSEVDELRRVSEERERLLDRLRSDDTEHRAELRELQRQTRELERQMSSTLEALRQRDARIAELEARVPPEAR